MKDPQISLHRFPADKEKRRDWLAVLGHKENEITPSMRVCSRHFLGGDAKNLPTVILGKKFCSPAKKNPRNDRSKLRDERRIVFGMSTPGMSKSVTEQLHAK